MIIPGIIKAINEKIGRYTCYTEQVKQDLKKPCFFILQLDESNFPQVGKREIRRYYFDVHYFPASNLANDECWQISNKLFKVLRWIEVDGGICRGITMRGEIVDNVLHFFVAYQLLLNEIKEDEPMESLEQNIGLKG